MANNVCPHPPSPEGLAINEVGGALGPNHTQESMFVELIGPPQTSLDGLVVMVFEGRTREAIPLQGHIGDDGLFLLNHTSGTGVCVFVISRRVRRVCWCYYCYCIHIIDSG